MWQTSRYECKYLIPHRQLDEVRAWIGMFLVPDRHALALPHYTYTIGSLYLDSPHLMLYRMTAAGLKNRFKLRIRSYSDDPAAPLFFEIKRRIDRVIRKSRVTLAREDGRRILGGELLPCHVAAGENCHHLETFMELARAIGAAPMARIRYRREAYESPAGDTVRLTLDSALTYAPTPGVDFSFDGAGWGTVPMSGTLLEVKFNDHYPKWIAEMIRRLELAKIPFSKYNLSIERMLHAPPAGFPDDGMAGAPALRAARSRTGVP